MVFAFLYGLSMDYEVFAFAALAVGPQVDVKILATGLAAGILLDATIVRALLVPAAVSLFGRWNWYLPDTAAKLLRVRPFRAGEPSWSSGDRPVVAR
ncbi:MMPL family transporter [Conexibacter sp. CPCC 206217]|uniref:MMPL family transporter n=1 Tax=Conexibacter sp. CPCC 206217 TaxID=3064574 RepID=UPI002723DCE1|nr:MMPL family transporter [Conexibacter sp. CPCC 206217]MDO8209723.1 MMPL family transporter [Conexibacter sp. CPCC 206217]